MDITRDARRGALEVLRAILFASTDSGILDPFGALHEIVHDLCNLDADSFSDSFWGVEELARVAALRAKSREDGS